MVVRTDTAPDTPPGPVVPAAHATTSPGSHNGGPSAGRAATVRRIAEASGQRDLGRISEDVLRHAVELFDVEGAGLWVLEEGDRPFRLVRQHGLAPSLVDAFSGQLPTDRGTTHRGAAAALRAVANLQPEVVERHATGSTAKRTPESAGDAGADCYVPVFVLNEPLGIIVLSRAGQIAWTADQLDLAAAFGAQTGIAIQNARLYGRVQAFAARLEAIKDLAGNLNGIHEVAAIGQAIVTEIRHVFESDSARVYAVDHASGMCEPIAFGGLFLGESDPSRDALRVEIGRGLTGWVAANNTPLRLADARTDPRRLKVGSEKDPESMLFAPMTYEDVVRGVIVVSKLGFDRYADDDLTTLSIFAGFAAQSLVNAENMERLGRQQFELEQRLAGQRALLDVNETLLGWGDPRMILDLIADGLKTVVRYDNLTIYRLDHQEGVRVAVLARDRFADIILAEKIPIASGLSGWAVERGEAILANDAQLDPRAMNIPGTPMEPESLIVVPLRVGGEVIGTLNVGRMGEAESHFTNDEFELVKLFAGQASIALQTAEALQAAVLRADLDALTGLRNHGAFQAGVDELLLPGAAATGAFALLMLDLDGFKSFNDGYGHPAGDRLLRAVADALRAAVRDGDRVYRYGGDEFAILLPGVERAEAEVVADRLAAGVAAIRGLDDGPGVTISIGIAMYPDDGRTKSDLVALADAGLYVAKAGQRHAGPPERGGGMTAASEISAMQERLVRQASYDVLTSLPNRSLLLDRVGAALASARPGEPAPVAVLLLDLDRFKVVNESLGHAIGDQILAAVGARLGGALRPGDTLARLGGDEFAVLLDGTADEDGARLIAQRLVDTLAAPFPVDGRDINVGASVGVAIATDVARGPADLLRDAEIALYRAKASSLSRVAVFEASMGGATRALLELETDLRHAVERGELRLHYQPLVDLRSGTVVGHEALVRWEHPSRGLLGAEAFISVAEETGLIHEIGQWVLAEACRQTRAWQLALPSDPPLIVSVNLSARQFTQPDLAASVAAVLTESHLPAASLELEITETVAMSDAPTTGVTLRALRELGIRLGLDDFGTGYSSLAYLSQMALDTLKIDRAFVTGLSIPGANTAIIAAIAALAHGLGLEVTAEGIEEPDQLAAVIELGCDRGQGFLFATPLPADEAEAALIADRVRDLAATAGESAA